MDIHYWRNNRERPRFFRSATFICTWNGLRKSRSAERGLLPAVHAEYGSSHQLRGLRERDQIRGRILKQVHPQ